MGVYVMNTKHDSRENILAAARRLFHIQGYHATGLNQILKESGAPKGSLYYYFPNGKEQLAIEAVNTMAQFIITDIQNHLKESENACEALQYHLRCIANRFDDIDNIECIPIGLLAAETSSISEPLRMACKTAFESWEALYRQKLIESGMEPDQAHQISFVINALIEGAITRSLTTKDGQPLRYAADCIPLLLQR